MLGEAKGVSIEYPSEVKRKWFSTILHVAKGQRGFLSLKFDHTLGQGILLDVYQGIPAAQDLRKISYDLNIEQPIIQLARDIEKSLDSKRTYMYENMHYKTILTDITDEIRAKKHDPVLAKIVEPAVKLVKFLRKIPDLYRNDRQHEAIAQTITFLNQLVRWAPVEVFEASTFMTDYSALLWHQMLKSSSHMLKRHCALSFVVLSLCDSLLIDPTSACVNVFRRQEVMITYIIIRRRQDFGGSNRATYRKQYRTGYCLCSA